jgi:ribosome-associated protein
MKTPPRRPRKRSKTASPLPTELTLAIAAALEKKAMDVVVLDLRKASAFTDFFVICTGGNSRQIEAIAEAIQGSLARHGTKPALVEGLGRSEWILIDYFDFIVHIFTPATREFYGLERLWGDAERVEVSA